MQKQAQVGQIETHCGSLPPWGPAFVCDEGRRRVIHIVTGSGRPQALAMLDLYAIHQLLAVALVFCLAGFVKGVVGLGLPTLAMGLLAVVMTPAEAAAILVLPSLVTNAWQLLFGPSLVSLARRLWPMLGGICIGTWAGAGQIAGADAEIRDHRARRGAGGLRACRPERHQLRRPAGGGALAVADRGRAHRLVTAATGVFVLPAVPYLQSLGLRRDELVQALAMSFTVSTIALAAGLVGVGVFGSPLARVSVMAVVPALVGVAIGQRVRGRLGPDAFRRWFFKGLLALGLWMAVRTVV